MYTAIHCTRLEEAAVAPAGFADTEAEIFALSVVGVTVLGAEIRHYRLRRPEGGDLPAWTAGAHIHVHLPDGKIRAYSLCGDPDETSEYHIAVKREVSGRGGSRALHEIAREGALLKVGIPRNLFALSGDDRPCMLLGGGIGVTPLISMACVLQRRGIPFRFAVFARSEQHLPLPGAWRDQPWGASVEVFLTEGEAGRTEPADQIREIIASAPGNSHIYYCGPAGFMRAIDAASLHWDRDRIHFERFSASVGDDAAHPAHAEDACAGAARAPGTSAAAFDIVLARTGRRVAVAAGQSAGQALHAAGVPVEMVCEQGVCGSCVTRWLDGQPLHRDECLTDAERDEYVAICCVRSAGPTLTLNV